MKKPTFRSRKMVILSIRRDDLMQVWRDAIASHASAADSQYKRIAEAQIKECAACLRLAQRQRYASFFIFAIKARLKKLKAHGATNNGPQKRATGSETLHELANSFRRMGDDANHVRLKHLRDAKIREPWAAAANAYYNCTRTVRALLPTPIPTKKWRAMKPR